MVLLVLGYDKNTPIASWNAYMKGCMLIYLFIDERTPFMGRVLERFFFFTLITHLSVTTQHSFIVKTQYSSKKWNKV